MFLTNVFPSPWLPTKGTFNLELARALAAHHELTVVNPIAWADELSARREIPASIHRDRRQTRDGFDVHYPRFYYPPKIGRRWYHRFMWHSLKPGLRRIQRDLRPQAVLGYWAHPDGTVAVRYAREIGATAFVMCGGSDVLLQAQGSSARRSLIATTLQSADGVVVVGDNLRRRVIELGVSPQRAHVVSRGVDRERFYPEGRKQARARLGLPADRPIFLWVGRMVPVKGLETLIAAAQKLNDLGQEFELVLIGDGSERRRLEQLTKDSAIAGRVRFVGTRPHAELADWYRAADRTVLTSHSEGVPNVLLESHACGTPFIATRVGGVSEIAEPGVDQLTPPGDAGEFCHAMASAIVAGPADGARLSARVAGLDAAASAIGRLLDKSLSLPQAEVAPPLAPTPAPDLAGSNA